MHSQAKEPPQSLDTRTDYRQVKLSKDVDFSPVTPTLDLQPPEL